MLLRFFVGVAASTLLALPVSGQPAPGPGTTLSGPQRADRTPTERPLTSFTFFLENDVLPHAGAANEDRNYTGGFGFQFGGSFISDWRLDRPLELVDRLLRVSRAHAADQPRFHTLLVFGTGFTPDDLNTSDVITDDRPYGSIVGVSVRRMTVDDRNFDQAWTSELAIGLLGGHTARNLQRWFHGKLRGPGELTPYDPLGWHNQISDGGEVTGLYRVTYERWLAGDPTGDSRKHWQASWGGQAGVGYFTNAALLTNLRVGAFNGDFWAFVPGAMSVGTQVATDQGLPGWELFGFVGLRGRAVAYNALLQGQFRDSVHTVDPRRLVAEWDLGAAASVPFLFGSRLQVVYNAWAGRSPEFRGGGRSHAWGSLAASLALAERRP